MSKIKKKPGTERRAVPGRGSKPLSLGPLAQCDASPRRRLSSDLVLQDTGLKAIIADIKHLSSSYCATDEL